MKEGFNEPPEVNNPGESTPPPPRREAPKYRDPGTFGTSLFAKLQEVGVAVNKNPESVFPPPEAGVANETIGQLEVPPKKVLETTGEIISRRGGVEIGRFTPHEPKSSSPDSPGLLTKDEEETMSGLVEQVLNDSLNSIAPKTTELSAPTQDGRLSRQSELGQDLPKVDPAFGHHEMLSYADTKKLEREGAIDPKKNDVRMSTSFMKQDTSQYNKQEVDTMDRGSQGSVEVQKGKVEDDPENKNRFRVRPLGSNPQEAVSEEELSVPLDAVEAGSPSSTASELLPSETSAPSSLLETSDPQAEAIEEINPYNFPDRMFRIDDYSPADDPNFPKRFNGEPPTNSELQEEIAVRRAAWKKWKKAMQPVTSDATDVAGVPVFGSISDVLSAPEAATVAPSESSTPDSNPPAPASEPSIVTPTSVIWTPPRAPETPPETPVSPQDVELTPPSSPAESSAPYTAEDLQAYVEKEKSLADNPIYTAKDLKDYMAQGGPQGPAPEGTASQPATPETPPNPFEGVSPEARRQTREMLYKMQKGISEIDPKDPGFLEYRPAESIELAALEVHKNRTDLLDRFKTKAVAGKKLKKSGGTEGATELAEAEIWLDNANIAFEASMDGLKREMLVDFLRKKKEAYPKLTKKQLEKEALQYSSRFVLEAAQNQYQQVATAEAAIVDEQEKGRLRRMLETYAKWPKGRRVILSAAIGAGAATGGALLFGAGGIVAAASYGAYRGARALVGGGLGAGINELIERGYTKKKYGKERAATREAQWAETEANLASQLQEGEDWLNDQEKLLSLMTLVDSDAKTYQKKLEGIAAKEQRTRTKAAIISGLAGGVIANIDNIYGAAQHLFSGSKGGVESAVVGGAGVPLEARPTGVFPGSPEDIAKLGEATDMATETVPRGSSLWDISRGFEKKGLITHDQWVEAWQNSTTTVIKNGVPTEVPFSETGLIHAGDQVIMVKDAAGHVRFQALDLVKDKLPMGDNQMYYDFLQKGGKPVPQWLENAVHAKAPTPIEHASSMLGVGAGREGTIAALSAEAAHPLTTGEAIYSALDQERVMEEFTHRSLFHQELDIQHLDGQRDALMDHFKHAQTSQEAASWSEQLKNLESIRSQMALSPEYLQNLQNLRTELLNHGVKLDLVEKLGGMKVKDFMAIADFETLRGVPGPRLGEAESLAMMLRDMRPGKLERNMSVLDFLKLTTSQ